jgi:hypothetical protein
MHAGSPRSWRRCIEEFVTVLVDYFRRKRRTGTTLGRSVERCHTPNFDRDSGRSLSDTSITRRQWALVGRSVQDFIGPTRADGDRRRIANDGYYVLFRPMRRSTRVRKVHRSDLKFMRVLPGKQREHHA